ncbi:aldo/keto reductase [Rugosimonospora acidiphila]|uniref:Aldo/keto reductase n=1 Tax=Rugosimonospora acidiphila TaxID=556531 RepID=A0ABP9RLV8_9ACTN
MSPLEQLAVDRDRANIPLPRFGIGLAPAGKLPEAAEAQARGVVREALARGVTLLDTAPRYGNGRSERRLAAVLREQPLPPGSIIATKAGHLATADGPVADFTRAGIRRGVEDSLGRLGVDHIDLLHLHDPDDAHALAIAEALPAMRDLRAAGVVRAIGVAMNHPHPLARFVRETDVDCVLLAGRYTLLDQTGLKELLPLCQSRRVPVIAAGVFNSGILADPVPGAPYDYRPAAPELLARSRAIQALCEQHGVPLAAAAMRFPLGHPAIATVLVGADSAAQVRDNLRLFHHPVPDELWVDLARHRLVAPVGDLGLRTA